MQVRQAQRWSRLQGLELLDTDLLLAYVLGKTRTWLFTWPERELNEQQHQQFRDLVQRRCQGEPVAHLVGEREFWSLPLRVNASTLIPRPDTETLVEAVLERFKAPALRVADLGTGTGAIALALASERPDWSVSAFDVMPDAVALARDNAVRLGLPVSVGHSHWCAALADRSLDILVSNPPYIAEDDEHLQQGDVRYEPLSALVAADAGMADIETLTDEGRRVLVPGGWLFLEHGWAQGALVRDCFERWGYGSVTTLKDLGGRDRVSFGQWLADIEN
jgi:release factor glutamine methyltransferase